MDAAFFELVTRLRHAQKAYFQTRSTEALKTARYLERLTDMAIEEETKPRAEPSLFDRITGDVEKG